MVPGLCTTCRRSETGLYGCGRYAFDHRAAALVMLVYSWLAMHAFPLNVRQRTYNILCAADNFHSD